MEDLAQGRKKKDMLLLKGKWFRCSSFFWFGEIIRFPLPAGLANIEEPNFGDKKSKATTTAGIFQRGTTTDVYFSANRRGTSKSPENQRGV